MGKLYIVATPIGNLKDITFRALEVLKNSDFVLAENIKISKKLLSFYNVKKPLKSLREETSDKNLFKIANLINSGKSASLIVSAGTPVISDPGAKLIDLIYQNFPNVKVIPVPGPSAVISALSCSGFRGEKFCFWGFPPKKKKRKKFFESICKNPNIQVLFVSPHSILKDLESLKEAGLNPKRKVFLAKEMTKIYERFYRGSLDEIISILKKEKIKGEFTLVIDKEPKNES